MKFTLADFIAMNIRSFPDRQALDVLGGAGESYTYRDMWLRVSALADALREVEPGPHGPAAATLLPNGADALLIYLAGQLAGCAIVPVNTRLALPEILHIVNDSGAQRIFAGGDLLAMAAGVAGAAGQDATVIDVAHLPTPVGLRDPAVSDPARCNLPSHCGRRSIGLAIATCSLAGEVRSCALQVKGSFAQS